MRPAWFPDWSGECAAIVASGPSTSKADVALLRDRIHVIAIKKSIELCPFADVVYGCDAPWWKSVAGLPEFKGLKLAWQGDSHLPPPVFPDLKLISLETFKGNSTPAKYAHCDRILTDRPGHIGSGGNSGFQALNLAVQFGATGVLLIGFDLSGRNGAHWYGRNSWPKANNPDGSNFIRWHKAFTDAAPGLTAMDVQVINGSASSALTCFPKRTIEQALAGWGL